MEPQRPRAWIAFLLAANLPGWGHFYAGSFAGALACLVLAAASFWLIVWLFGTPFGSAWPIAITFLLVIAVMLAQSLHAARVAARREQHWISGRWRRIGACVAYVFVAGWIIDEAATRIARSRIEPFHIPSHAMYPTLLAGDYVVADVSQRTREHLERGQIVVYTMAREGGRLVPADEARDLPRERFVKRLVGLPGDTLVSSGDGIRIDGNDVPRRALGPAIEPGRVFLLGDNRDNSNDSRYSGTTPMSDVVGVVTHIYFSRDPETGAIRWDRIGRLVR